MPVFRARGRTRWGDAFAVRFEAPSERTVRAWLTTESAAVEELRQLPLTAWPLSMTRLPWLIFLFPLVGYGLFTTTVMSALVALDLSRVGPARSAYQRLAAAGATTVGTIIGERQTSLRGIRVRVLDYRFITADRRVHSGTLAPGPGHVADGRHDLRLVAGTTPALGAEVAVTYLPADPTLHAPFAVDDALLAHHAELSGHLPGQLAKLILAALVCAWLLRNFLVRLGSHYELSAGPPHIVLLTRGDNPFVGPADDADHSGE
jgi:hypothetical protein